MASMRRGFLGVQRLDVDVLADWRVHKGCDIDGYLAALPGDLERARDDAVDLDNRVGLEALSGEIGVEDVEMLRLQPVEAMLAELRNDPVPYFRLVGAVQGSLRRSARRDCGQPSLEPVGDSQGSASLAGFALVTLALELLDLASDLGLSFAAAVAAIGGAVVLDAQRDVAMPAAVRAEVDG